MSHNVHQAHAPKVLAVVQVVKRAGVSVTIAARPRAVVVMPVASRAPTPRAATSRLPIAVSAVSPHVVISPSHLAVTSLLRRVAISRLQIVAKNPSPRVAIGLLPHVVKNHMHPVVKNRLAIVATHPVVINLMLHAATILTRMRAQSHVRLSPALIVVLQIAQRMQASLLAPHVTLRLVLPHQVVKPLHHAVTAQHARAHLAPVHHVPQRVHVVALPLTAVAVKL